MNRKVITESVLNQGLDPVSKKKLFEAWSPHLKALEQAIPGVSDTEKVNLAVCLENAKK